MYAKTQVILIQVFKEIFVLFISDAKEYKLIRLF